MKKANKMSSSPSQVMECGDLPPPPPAPYHDSRNFTLSPETTDCDSADLESELSVPSVGEGSFHSSGPRHTSMPILEVRLDLYTQREFFVLLNG